MSKTIFFQKTKILILVATAGLVFAPFFSALAGFDRNLSLGDSGADVRELQELLNSDSRTKVASFGPGSSGEETTFFGSLTHDAVIRFQELYASEILRPISLLRGTGFVGLLTRGKLNQLNRTSAEILPRQSEEEVTNTKSELSAGSSLTDEEIVQKNIRETSFIVNLVLEEGQKQGLSQNELSQIEREIKSTIATTTDLAALFRSEIEKGLSIDKNFNDLLRDTQDKVRRLSQTNFPDESLSVMDFFQKAVFDFSLFGKQAQAQTFLHFGGRVVGIPCTCTGGAVWKVGVTPPSPAIADYIIGTQASLWYNFATVQGVHSVGKILTGPQICWMTATPCVLIPGEGVITPIVGTSLSPGI